MSKRVQALMVAAADAAKLADAAEVGTLDAQALCTEAAHAYQRLAIATSGKANTAAAMKADHYGRASDRHYNLRTKAVL